MPGFHSDKSSGLFKELNMKIVGSLDTDPFLWQCPGAPVLQPKPRLPEWRPLEHAPYIEINRQGQLRTNLPLPKQK